MAGTDTPEGQGLAPIDATPPTPAPTPTLTVELHIDPALAERLGSEDISQVTLYTRAGTISQIGEWEFSATVHKPSD